MAESSPREVLNPEAAVGEDGGVAGPPLDFKQVVLLRTLYDKLRKQEKEDLLTEPTDQAFIDSYLSHEVHSSDTALSLHKYRVAICILPEDTVARSEVVIVRVLEPGVKTIGWSSVVEDEFGHVCILDVYNGPPPELLCPGTELLIKEPYLKRTDNQLPLIRCDCPANIIILRKSHPYYYLLQGVKWHHEPRRMTEYENLVYNPILGYTASQFAGLGEILALRGYQNLAVECFKFGLNRTICPYMTLHWRRHMFDLSVSFVALGYYDKTIEVLKEIPLSKHVAFCAGQAYYHLRLFNPARALFKKLVDTFPEDTNAVLWLQKTKLRLFEENTTEYPLDDLVVSSLNSATKRLDHADHVGPVKVDWNRPDGPSVIVTCDVEAGQVLMVSKAFACSFSSDRRVVEVLAEAVQAVYKNPETLGPRIYSLSKGWQPGQVIQPYCDPVTKFEPICDVERIKGVCRAKLIAIDHDTKDVGLGLFVMPSYMKHSCQPNVSALFFGDMMIVFSDIPLTARSEVFFNYTGIPMDSPYKLRKEALDKRGIECKCPNCLFEI